MSPPCPPAAQLEQILTGGPDADALLAHVRACAACRRELARLGAVAETAWPSVPDPFPGEFRLVRTLGEGAFGQVWLADDLHLGRPAALKTLRPRRAGAEALALLRNEARLLATLRHPNVVQVYAWRQSGQDHYLIEQYVPGGSLADRLKRTGPLPWQEAARYVADVGEGLVEVHARGIIHRDIKPDNVLWDPDKDEALLTDFGVSARLADAGSVAGTALYMAPEAFEGRVLPAMDVYSLAATLFHLTAGEAPFAAPSAEALVGCVLAGLPDPDPRFAGMPAPLEAIVRRGLAATPEGRPALPDFVAGLRGALNQVLVDALAPKATSSLRLVVSREAAGRYVPVSSSMAAPEPLRRDIKKVPRPPEQVRLRSGDRVRVEVLADHDGYVAVFNVGPTGNLNLLYPDEGAAGEVRAGRALHVLDVELTPPAGRERLFALWSRRPLPVRPEELLSLAESGGGASKPYRASRDMQRVRKSVEAVPPDEWRAAVLELDHAD